MSWCQFGGCCFSAFSLDDGSVGRSVLDETEMNLRMMDSVMLTN